MGSMDGGMVLQRHPHQQHQVNGSFRRYTGSVPSAHGSTRNETVSLSRAKLIQLIKLLNPFRNIKTKIMFAFIGATLLQLVLTVIVIQTYSGRELEKDAGNLIGELALQMTDKMDRFMFERYREIEVMATLPVFTDPSTNYTVQRKLLDTILDTYPVYSFVALAVNQTVRASALGLIEKANVSARPWYSTVSKTQQPYVGDVHTALLLQKVLAPNSSEPLRFVDAAAPVFNQFTGQFYGVLAAHLSFVWTATLSASVVDAFQKDVGIELFIIDGINNVLLVPPGYPYNFTAPHNLNVGAYINMANTSASGFTYWKSQWPDPASSIEGKTDYLIGMSVSTGFLSYPGLGWKVVVRQPIKIAYAKANAVTLGVILIGVGLMVAFLIIGYLLAWHLTRPILGVVKAADDLLSRVGTRNSMSSEASPLVAPRGAANSEVKVLFESLNSLVQVLTDQAHLQTANNKLQADVVDYTSKLLTSAEMLKDERMEKDKIEGVLFNVLPSSVATRLKNGERILADHYSDITIFFSDIVGFTPLCEQLTPTQVVMFLNDIFSEMDALTEKYQMDRIRTIGDSYFAVGGMSKASSYHTYQVLCFAYNVLQLVDKFNSNHEVQLSFRIGAHCGYCVGSVIGTKQVSFDLWGDSINVASRMESTGIAGRIQVTQILYERTKDLFEFEEWPEHEVKGRGMMKTYFLLRPRSDVDFASIPQLSHFPNICRDHQLKIAGNSNMKNVVKQNSITTDIPVLKRANSSQSVLPLSRDSSRSLSRLPSSARRNSIDYVTPRSLTPASSSPPSTPRAVIVPSSDPQTPNPLGSSDVELIVRTEP